MPVFKEYNAFQKFFKFTKRFVFNQGLDQDALNRYRELQKMISLERGKGLEVKEDQSRMAKRVKELEECEIPKAKEELENCHWFWTRRKARKKIDWLEGRCAECKKYEEKYYNEYLACQDRVKELIKEQKSYEWY